MRRVCVGSCGTTCLTEFLSVQARLATRIGFYGLLQGSNGCHWFRFFSISPAYISMSRTTLMLSKAFLVVA